MATPPIQPIPAASASWDPQSLRGLSQIGDARERAEAVATEMESAFFGMVMKAMRATVPESELTGRGLGRSNYVQMLDEQLAQMAGMPRDPRFHEALVNQILQEAQAGQEGQSALDELEKGDAALAAAASKQELPHAGP